MGRGPDVFLLEPALGGRPSPLEILDRYLESTGEAVQRGDVESMSRDPGDGCTLVDATRSTGTLLSWLQARETFPQETRPAIRLHVMAQGPATSVLRTAGLLRKIQPYLGADSLVLWRSDASGALSNDETTYPKLMGALSALDGAVIGTVEMGTTLQDATDDRIFPQLGRIEALAKNAEAAPVNAEKLPDDAINRLATILGNRLGAQIEAAAKLSRAAASQNLLFTLEPALDAATARMQHAVTTTLTDLEQRLGESSEQRLAARLQGLGDRWAADVRDTVVGAATVFIERTNAAFGKKAEHFTGRLEAFAQGELERDKRFRSVAGEAAAQATRASLQAWVEPVVGLKGMWFAAGAAACAACLVAGTLMGYVLARAGV